MSLRFESCDKCGQGHAVYACDRCQAEIVGVGVASQPFRVVVTAPGSSSVESHMCGSCAVELAKLGVSILPLRKVVGGATCGRDSLCALIDGHAGDCFHDRWVCDCGECENFRRAEETHDGGPIP